MPPTTEYIQHTCQLDNLLDWFIKECNAIQEPSERRVVLEVGENLSTYFCWPIKAELLWDGCDRTRENAQKQRYHTFPIALKELAKENSLQLDGRSNGPAIASYLLARGERPKRFSGNHKWSIHHIYHNKFPYPGKEHTLHAVKEPKHFTQSAGLVAVHPIADQMCDEYPFVSWLLRAESYLRFGYDPDGVFTQGKTDIYGFIDGKRTAVRYSDGLGLSHSIDT